MCLKTIFNTIIKLKMADYNTVFTSSILPIGFNSNNPNYIPTNQEINLMQEINIQEEKLRVLRFKYNEIQRDKINIELDKKRISFPSDIITEDVLNLYMTQLKELHPNGGPLYGRLSRFYEAIKSHEVNNIFRENDCIKFSCKVCKAIYSISKNKWSFHHNGYH